MFVMACPNFAVAVVGVGVGFVGVDVVAAREPYFDIGGARAGYDPRTRGYGSAFGAGYGTGVGSGCGGDKTIGRPFGTGSAVMATTATTMATMTLIVAMCPQP